LVAASSLEGYRSQSGQIHGNVSRYVFGFDPPAVLIQCGGFGKKDGQWRFRSQVYNGNISSDGREMS